IAIISILASMLLPALNKAREAARKISCTSNLKQVGTGMSMYLNDGEDCFPYGLVKINGASFYWNAAIDPYLGSNSAKLSYTAPNGLSSRYGANKVWVCPSVSFLGLTDWPADPYKSPWARRYHANNYLIDRTKLTEHSKLSHVRKPTKTIVALEGARQRSVTYTTAGNYIDGRHSGNSNILLVDGHVASGKVAPTTFLFEHQKKFIFKFR
ncbi:MAG: DUF1559 domain-containing protein, partial [Victivallaceae bacterium]|nr:DUF1559 domain-containing protein [Victivallaceae bacterium]